MEIPCILAMTGAEFTFCREKPQNLGWMACHFSPYGTGLSNIPQALPPGSMLILNDRIPICRHDQHRIADELCTAARQLSCSSILLDLQRHNSDENAAVVDAVLSKQDLPVGVSHLYAKGLDCPVFLSPPPLDVPLRKHLSPWIGREIWLEAAPEAMQYIITEEGCTSLYATFPEAQEDVFREEMLCCSYQWKAQRDAVVFRLWRSRDDLAAMLSKASQMGVTRGIGLYQLLKDYNL